MGGSFDNSKVLIVFLGDTVNKKNVSNHWATDAHFCFSVLYFQFTLKNKYDINYKKVYTKKYTKSIYTIQQCKQICIKR